MSKELRYSIAHMAVEYRRDIGMEIRSTLRELKYEVYKSLKYNTIYSGRDDQEDKVTDLLNKVKILMDECVKDNLLLVKGPYTIIQPRKRLKEILERRGTTLNVQQ